MISFAYRNFVSWLKAFPLCPLPQAIGTENIPFKEPVLYVYNHVTRGAEPLFLGLAAPSSPPLRFLAEITVLGGYLRERTRRDVANSVFPPSLRAKAKKYIITRFLLEKAVDFLTEYFITQMRRFNIIPVYLHDPPTPEERLIKRQVNRRALEACLASLEENIPLAIAPSGGSTHEAAEVDAVQTIVPTLASFLYRKGKIVKIVPCVIKQRPPVTKQTYAAYLVDRVWLLRTIKSRLKRLKGEKYCRPQVTVEFLRPLTFPFPYPTKSEKVAFVQRLQQLMFKALNANSSPGQTG